MECHTGFERCWHDAFWLGVFPTLLALFGLATGRDRKHVKRGTNGTNDKAKASETICARSVIHRVLVMRWCYFSMGEHNQWREPLLFIVVLFLQCSSLTPCLEDHTISRFAILLKVLCCFLRPLQEKLSPLSPFSHTCAFCWGHASFMFIRISPAPNKRGQVDPDVSRRTGHHATLVRSVLYCFTYWWAVIGDTLLWIICAYLWGLWGF